MRSEEAERTKAEIRELVDLVDSLSNAPQSYDTMKRVRDELKSRVAELDPDDVPIEVSTALRSLNNIVEDS